ncbi:hypothetical protein Trydic_g11414 [Trypoxylus dichotomus]
MRKHALKERRQTNCWQNDARLREVRSPEKENREFGAKGQITVIIALRLAYFERGRPSRCPSRRFSHTHHDEAESMRFAVIYRNCSTPSSSR